MTSTYTAITPLLVDHVSPALRSVDALLSRFGFPNQLASDPLTIAIECAVHAVALGGPDPHAIGMVAIDVQPPNATDFERGLAMGIALCLATEPKDD